MNTSYIVGGRRTPLGRFLGGLSSLTAPQLASHSIKQSLIDSGVSPGSLDQVIIGCVNAAGIGQAPARQAAIAAGIPDTIGAVTINKVCGSGLMSVMLADQMIRSGDANRILAGGMESMSNGPHMIQVRTGWKYGNQSAIDSVAMDGLQCAIGNVPMGHYAEQVASQHGVTRQQQDEWAVSSHKRALAADQGGKFANEIVPIQVNVGKTSSLVNKDEGARSDCSMESLGKLRPAFLEGGTVTAGNASPLSDGAASVLVVDEATLNTLPKQPAFRIISHANHAGPASQLFTAPIEAIQKALKKSGRTISEIDLFEINEAFASQVLACAASLQIDPAKLNVHGGAIAIGHPLGCSGTRILVTLMHAMIDRMARTGIASLCLGGGESVAMLIERIDN